MTFMYSSYVYTSVWSTKGGVIAKRKFHTDILPMILLNHVWKNKSMYSFI